MPQTDADRTIALAGLVQATSLVRDIARTGGYDGDDFATCIDSLFKIDAADSADVYGGLRRVKTGLALFKETLSQPRDMDVTRYAISLLSLERKLARRDDLLRKIRAAIETGESQLEHFSSTHVNVIAGLADCYSNTVSTLTPRVMVNGEQTFLSQQDNANRIRALLLAGIRAALLWRQSGGGQLSLFLGRKKLIHTAERLLAEIRQTRAV